MTDDRRPTTGATTDVTGAGAPSSFKDKQGAKPDWPAQIADRVLRRHGRRIDAGMISADATVVVASGVSPSGPIHLGNLRELMVPHFVTEEIRSRGVPCDHLLSWDDYDRLRKIPTGVPESFAEHIGRPLSGIPDPEGDLASYAERFKAPIRESIRRLGMDIREVDQSAMYAAGSYRTEIIRAIELRGQIDEVLGGFRTLEAAAGAGEETNATSSDAGRDEDVLVSAGAEDEPTAGGGDYWPYKVYCQACGRDLTEIERVEPGAESYVIAYRCTACDYASSFDLYEENHGKLVWKVDWPMRWAFEGVTFEAAGADHSSPGSSFSVGAELVGPIFGGDAPEYEAYSFVGIRGMGKLSSSKGAVPTPTDALEVLEPPILRWMYVRKTPRQGITVDLGSGIHALYDEWDTLTRKVGDGSATPAQVQTYGRAASTSIVERSDGPAAIVPFRTLASAISVAAGDDEQLARIIGELTDVPASDAPKTEPRLSLARNWLEQLAPDDERINVRVEPDTARLAALDETEAGWLTLLRAHLEDDWTLEGARSLVYGVPKLAAGLPLDTSPTDELKAQQREFFKLLYELFLDADTGPRMPTLLMALGVDRVRLLIGKE